MSFEIDDYDKADWAVRRISTAQRKIEERTMNIKHLKEMLDERLKELNAGDLRDVGFLQEKLEPFAQQEIARQYKKKSINTLSGSCGVRDGGKRVVVQDEEELLTWCECNCPEAIKKSILVSRLNKEEVTKGEIPGAGISFNKPTFWVKGNDKLLEKVGEFLPDFDDQIDQDKEMEELLE